MAFVKKLRLFPSLRYNAKWMNKKSLVKFHKEWKSFRLRKHRFKTGPKIAFFQSG